ncbi:EcoKI restriction-modification system protein HsdS [uncultured Oscillibacter sp.]|uniref:restriction endonuclease subunit S n=1 Tax=Oscillospiraceae TaxID=216572 RepID=UPI0008224BA5|nr:restriction endonuclease subunit S [Oscillibacter acetigenes]MCQ5045987.1 restriction endonuclease subunit S [Dysosmobacter welbionis]MCU6751598.1 restriction endonuclease subunit S [Oscillibacter acetigenes]SCJ89556.1 EcoKI restriction-modification system protein HsdS [uncultured Oscillibacter sp.]
MNFLDKITLNPPVPLKKGIAYPFIEMANVGSYQREPENVDTKVYSSGSRFADGDTIIARITPCLQNGKGFYCHNIGEGFGSTEFIVLRPKDQTVDSRYLYYLMQTNYIREKMIKSMVGASGRQRVNNDVFTSIDISFPKIEIQRRIADILSAYDDLIENNRKQIKLLEEAAQRLYKEWFVDLRFPGYEHTKITDGVPEGWDIRAVSDFGKVITGKTPSTSKPEYYGGNIPFVTIPDMHNTIFPLSTEKYLSKQGANTQKNKFLPPHSVMVSCIATVGLVNITCDLCQTNQQINSVILKDEKELYFFYFAMKRIKSLLDGVGSNGATMTNVNKTKFENIRILYPESYLGNHFFELCHPIFQKILILSKENQYLQQARDRLLPKLMSGEVEV